MADKEDCDQERFLAEDGYSYANKEIQRLRDELEASNDPHLKLRAAQALLNKAIEHTHARPLEGCCYDLNHTHVRKTGSVVTDASRAYWAGRLLKNRLDEVERLIKQEGEK